jgi:hypothetical protein
MKRQRNTSNRHNLQESKTTAINSTPVPEKETGTPKFSFETFGVSMQNNGENPA